MVDLWRHRAISEERKKEKRLQKEGKKTPNFLEALLAIEIMLELQANLEDKVNPSILKDDFSSRSDPSIFKSKAVVLLDWSDETN